MKHALPLGTTLLATALLYGCAAMIVPEPEPVEDTAFFLARFDKVWDAALTALEDEKIPIEAMNKDRGVMSTKFVNYSAGPKAHYRIQTIARKPSASKLAIFSQVGYSLSILVTPVNDMSTRVRVIAHIEAYDKNVSQEWHECTSNKLIENGIIQKIKARL